MELSLFITNGEAAYPMLLFMIKSFASNNTPDGVGPRPSGL